MLRQFTPIICALLLAHCGSDTPAVDGTSEAGRSVVELPPDAQVLEEAAATQMLDAAPKRLDAAGVQLTPTTNIFVAGTTYVGDPLPVLALIQADNADICRHLQQGTMPKDSSLFATVILQWDKAPFRTGQSYPGLAHSGQEQIPVVQGFFRKLDAHCAISPSGPMGAGLELNYGAMVLREYTPGKSVTADYRLRVEADGEPVDGHIEAVFCDAPKFFETPEAFLLPVDEASCK